MRVVWKDSRTYKTYKYREHIIEKSKYGWITDIPGDDNIYNSAECAHNAVDSILGGRTRKANPGRLAKGINIIGTKTGKDDLKCV